MDNISVKKYLTEKNFAGYTAIFQHLKPANNFIGKKMDVNAMPYMNVKTCVRLLSSEMDEEKTIYLFAICFNVSDEDINSGTFKEQFYNAPAAEYFAAKKYLTHTLLKVVENENKMFNKPSVDDSLWSMAGVERLEPYRDIAPLIMLGKELGQYPFDLGRKPYGEIFTMLTQNKIQAEVEQDFMKLKNNK